MARLLNTTYFWSPTADQLLDATLHGTDLVTKADRLAIIRIQPRGSAAMILIKWPRNPLVWSR